jgi:hypothetical protein
MWDAQVRQLTKAGCKNDAGSPSGGGDGALGTDFRNAQAAVFVPGE